MDFDKLFNTKPKGVIHFSQFEDEMYKKVNDVMRHGVMTFLTPEELREFENLDTTDPACQEFFNRTGITFTYNRYKVHPEWNHYQIRRGEKEMRFKMVFSGEFTESELYIDMQAKDFDPRIML